MDLLYFDGGGGMSLSMEIDGLPVDASAFYQSEADFTNSTAPMVPLITVDTNFLSLLNRTPATPAAAPTVVANRTVPNDDDDLYDAAGFMYLSYAW